MDNARMFGRAGAFFTPVASMVDGADTGLPAAKDSMDTEEHTALDSAINVWEVSFTKAIERNNGKSTDTTTR